MAVLNMIQICFLTRLSRVSRKSILYCRVTVNNLRQEFSTSIEVSNAVKWDKRKQICEAKNHEAAFINDQIDKTKAKLRQINTSLDNQNIIVTPDLVITTYKNPRPFMKKMLFAKIERYILHKSEVEKIAKGTQISYRKFYSNLKKYLNYKDTFVENINVAWANKYSEFLSTTKGCKSLAYQSRNVEFVKAALDHACEMGLLQSHYLIHYKTKRDKKQNPISLTNDELIKLMKYQFSSSMLTKAKDLFLFQSATGISYGDLWTKFEVMEVAPGKKVLIGKRIKNGNTFCIPCEPLVDTLLTKYNYTLPKLSNAVYNRLLKEIAACTGIEKRVTTHTGRKTFATLMNSEGWSRESIATMLGHSNLSTTETYYITKTIDRVIYEMQQRGRPNT